jgi:transcription initiation factor TFIID subunit 8
VHIPFPLYHASLATFLHIRLMTSQTDMVHQLSNVSLSMASSRRSQPIPQDFAFALWKQKLSLSCLGPHLQSPITPLISQQSLPTPPPEDPPDPPLSPILGPDLSGALDKQKAPYIPTHFPSLPSKHTYKATPEFTERERDPRKVRECATEEGRLGEDALRRLLGAASSGGHRASSSLNCRSSKLKQRNRMWEQTVEALIGASSLSSGDSGSGASRVPGTDRGLTATLTLEFGVMVNSEKEYWRKSAVSAQDGLRRQQKDVVDNQNEDVLMSGTGLISAP